MLSNYSEYCPLYTRISVDFSTLKADLQIMVDVLGSDPTETACEQECHKLLSSGHVLNYGCPFVCHA